MFKVKQGSSRRSANAGVVVPATLSTGIKISVNTGNIPESSWIHCHGVAKSTGAKVNSLKITQVGESTLVKEDSGFTASFNSNELEVAAIAFLQQRGYSSTYQGQPC